MKTCLICGRQLKKSPGIIGPGCLAKLKGQLKSKRISTKEYVKYMAKHDLFADEEDADGSRKTQRTSHKTAK